MLITTRDERVGKRLAGRNASISVDPMSHHEALDLLGLWNIESSDNVQYSDHSRSLLEALGYIPLAITQAAAFISENDISLSKYLELFRSKNVQGLLVEDLEDLRRDSQSDNSIFKTWKISFDLITKQRPRAAEILSLMAVLDRQGIPRSLLQNPSDEELDFTKAMGTLLAFSLIKAGSEEGVYEVHQLVQLATQKWLETQQQLKTWQESALSVVADQFPAGSFVRNRQLCESILPQAQIVIQYGEELGICSETYANLLCNMASFDGEYGRYELCVKRRIATYEMRKNLWGEEHPSTLTSMSRLARAYRDTTPLQTSHELHEKFVQTSKRVLGTEHRDTIVGIHSLAVIYMDLRRWEEAEKLLVQVIETFQAVSGVENQDALDAMCHLSMVYDEQGHHTKAIALSERCVGLRTRISGAEHPQTLVGMTILARFYVKEGYHSEGIDILEKVLRTKIYDLDHPWTLSCMVSLALAYSDVDRRSDAITLLEKVVDSKLKIGGAGHPITLNYMATLARVYGLADRRSEEVALLESLIDPFARHYGARHPITLGCMSNLATAYMNTDRPSNAIPLLRKVIESQGGFGHSDTLIYPGNLARLAIAYKRTDRENEVIPLLEKLVGYWTETLGAGHPYTMSAVEKLKGIRSMQRSNASIFIA